MNSIWASFAARALKYEDDFVRLCVLVYDRSGEPVVHCNEPELPRTDVSGSEFEVGAPTSEEEAGKKKSQVKRAQKGPLTAVPESW